MAAFRIGSSKVGSTDAVGVADAITVVVDDGIDGWWSGVNRCGAGVAIAGAAMALAAATAIAGNFTARGHADEVLPVTTPVGYSQGNITNQRAVAATTFLRWSQPDELPAAVAPPVLDDAPWQPLPAALPLPVVRQPWSYQDELPVTTTVVVDDSIWAPPVIAAPAIAAQPFSAPDELPQIADVPKGGAGPTDSGMRARHETRYLRFWLPDELPVTAAPALDDAAWQAPFIAQPLPFTPQTPWRVPDELPAIASPVLDDAAWQAPFIAQPLPFTAQTPWRVPDELPFTPTSIADTDAWWPAWPALQAVAISVMPAANPARVPDELPVTVAFAPDDTSGWNIDQRSRQDYTFTVWAETDDVAPAAAPAAPKGGAGPTDSGMRARHETRYLRFWQVDELPAAVAPLRDETQWAPPITALPAPVTRLPFVANDELPRPFNLAEYEWNVVTPPAPRALVPDPWREPDQYVVAAAPFGLTEYDQPVLPPIVSRITVRVFSDSGDVVVDSGGVPLVTRLKITVGDRAPYPLSLSDRALNSLTAGDGVVATLIVSDE